MAKGSLLRTFQTSVDKLLGVISKKATELIGVEQSREIGLQSLAHLQSFSPEMYSLQFAEMHARFGEGSKKGAFQELTLSLREAGSSKVAAIKMVEVLRSGLFREEIEAKRPLQIALEERWKQVALTLIEKGALRHLPSFEMAIRSGYESEAIRWFKAESAQPVKQNSRQRWKALANQFRFENTLNRNVYVALFLAQNAVIPLEEAVAKSVFAQDIDVLKGLLALHPPLEARDGFGDTAIHLAIKTGYLEGAVEIARAMRSRGLSIDEANHRGQTPRAMLRLGGGAPSPTGQCVEPKSAGQVGGESEHIEQLLKIESGLMEGELEAIAKWMSSSAEAIIRQGGAYLKKEETKLPRTLQVFPGGRVLVHLKRHGLKNLGNGHLKTGTLSLDWFASRLRANLVMHKGCASARHLTCIEREERAAEAIRNASEESTTHLSRALETGTYRVDEVEKVNLIYELCHGGGMRAKDMPDGPGSLARWKLFYQALLGVQQLHALGFIHRDLKQDNILLHQNDKNQLTAKISDFDLSGRINPDGVCIDAALDGYRNAEDVWAMGKVALISVLELEALMVDAWIGDDWSEVPSEDVSFESGAIWSVPGFERIVEKEGVDIDLRRLIVEMLEPKIEKRIGIDAVVRKMGATIELWDQLNAIFATQNEKNQRPDEGLSPR